MEQPKFNIKLEAGSLKLIRHPKREIKVIASNLSQSDAYAKLFPKDTSQDLLYFSLICHTISHINKNNCVIIPEEGMATYKSGTSKGLNIEHDRENLIGFCVNSFLSNLSDNKIIDEENAQEILANEGKVNVSQVYAVWCLNRPEEANLIEENFDENSENYNRIKASFEYYFNDYKFFVSKGGADYPDGTLYDSNCEDCNTMFDSLLMNGGNGTYKGNKISIAPIGGFLGGCAIVLNPANEYSDLTGIKENDKIILQNVEAVTETVITQHNTPEKSVIKDTQETMNTPTDIKAPVTKVEAAVQLTVDKDLANAIQVELDKKIKELNEKDTAFNELKATVEALKSQFEASKTEAAKASEMATKIQSELDKEVIARKALETKQAEDTKIAMVASRMEILSKIVEVNAENKAMLEKECEASVEDFAKKVEFYKSISKKTVASVVVAEVAKEDVKAAVKEAVAETAKESKSVSICVDAPSASLTDKFSKAFSTPQAFGFSDKKLVK